MTSEWDSAEIVSEKVMDRQQIKDVRKSAQNLLEIDTTIDIDSDKKALDNPTFGQPAYGCRF